MYIPRKIQYALRALFELARFYDEENGRPRSVQEIAERQAIPHKFLEGLLNNLKKGNFVISYRGKNGGYQLARRPDQISVADVLRFMQGPIEPVDCLHHGKSGLCNKSDQCVFRPMWEEIRQSTMSIYESKTLAHFVEEDRQARVNFVPNYTI